MRAVKEASLGSAAMVLDCDPDGVEADADAMLPSLLAVTSSLLLKLAQGSWTWTASSSEICTTSFLDFFDASAALLGPLHAVFAQLDWILHPDSTPYGHSSDSASQKVGLQSLPTNLPFLGPSFVVEGWLSTSWSSRGRRPSAT